MHKTISALGLLFLLTLTAAAQANRNSLPRGSWAGTGYQTDDNSTWTMKLTIKRVTTGDRAFFIEYPSLECGGRWRLLSTSGNKLRFRELLDHGAEKCANKGLVTIEKIGAQLIFLYSNAGTREITASAVLNRKGWQSGKLIIP